MADITSASTIVGDPNAPTPMLSKADEEQVITHLRALQAIVKNRGEKAGSAVLAAIPDASSSPEWADLVSHVCKRAIVQVQRCARKREQDAVSAYKVGVERILSPMRDKLVAVHAKFAAMDPVEAAILTGGKGAPTSLPVPLSTVSGVFPANTPPESMAKALKALGYTLSRQAKETYITVSLPTAAPEPAGERRAMNAANASAQ